ncbi:Uncharacterized protein SCF082_LOCUS20749 [Durusdinium trenchii]|uniref:Uncharacterized protein n=1 Tax=Durusdinium trenchii TaxID=1381693 RepID=A0ABP0L4K2_9DINO
MRRGFIRALEHTLRLKELGLLFAGLPCCSFIFLNLATSRRSRETPFGDTLKKYVFDSNVLAARLLILCAIAVVRGVHWEIEQPGSSTFVHFPYLRWIKRMLKGFVEVKVYRFWMAWYGSRTPKSTLLIGTTPWAAKLYKKLSFKDRVKLQLDSTGVTKRSGGPRLKETQVYPEKFGVAVAKHHLKLMAKRKKVGPYKWAHAELKGFEGFLVEAAQDGPGKKEPVATPCRADSVRRKLEFAKADSQETLKFGYSTSMDTNDKKACNNRSRTVDKLDETREPKGKTKASPASSNPKQEVDQADLGKKGKPEAGKPTPEAEGAEKELTPSERTRQQQMLPFFDNDPAVVDAVILRKKSDPELCKNEIRPHPENPSVMQYLVLVEDEEEAKKKGEVSPEEAEKEKAKEAYKEEIKKVKQEAIDKEIDALTSNLVKLRATLQKALDDADIVWVETKVKGKLRESEPVSKEIPIILPKDLLRYLFGELGVSIDAEEVRRYWQHARECGCPWGNLSDGDHHIPCALYGDSAKYSYIGEKITCVFFSLPLWNPRAARYRIWLLFALETYQTLGGLTINPLYRRIVESMWELYSDGLEVNGRTLHFAVSEIKGDWEWHVYSMGLSRLLLALLGYFGDCDNVSLADRLVIAYKDFKVFCRTNRMEGNIFGGRSVSKSVQCARDYQLASIMGRVSRWSPELRDLLQQCVAYQGAPGGVRCSAWFFGATGRGGCVLNRAWRA